MREREETEMECEMLYSTYLRSILFNFWDKNIAAPGKTDGVVNCCEAWKDFRAFERWAYLENWRRGQKFGRMNAEKPWEPDNCVVYGNRTGDTMTMTERVKFKRAWEKMQEKAAVKWLKMPEGTTAEQFRAELNRLGLLSKPKETENDKEE